MSSHISEEIELKGIPASTGVAVGPAFVYLHSEPEIPVYEICEVQFKEEEARFEDALLKTRMQISEIRNEVAEKLGESEAQIFDSHLLVIEDQALIEETIKEIEVTKRNVEHCFNNVSQRYIAFFEQLDDEYFKERSSDIFDVTKRILKNLMGLDNKGQLNFETPRFIITDDLNPSDTAGLEKDNVLGIITEFGGRTSHSVILARALQVPAVVGIENLISKIKPEDNLLIDGYEGLVYINPKESTLHRYGKFKQKLEKLHKVFGEFAQTKPETIDHEKIVLMANIDNAEDVETVKVNGADGVGLFRTEIMFLRSNSFPSEEEQYQEYKKLALAMAPQTAVIRTLDLGGDKMLDKGLGGKKEENPFMGFRAIRFCLKHTQVFKDQLRAILRASSETKNLKLLYPMICGFRELVQANAHLNEAKNELKAEGLAFDENIKVGCMIETPSAAMISDILAEECDFFSIGTNDLTQYTLAVDRVNNKIADLYEPCHPGVVRIMSLVLKTGKEKNIPVSICGEIASDPVYVPLLMGLGCTEFSGAPSMIPELKCLISRIKTADVKLLAEKALTSRRSREILALMRDYQSSVMDDLMFEKES